jgi:hypothetical protein
MYLVLSKPSAAFIRNTLLGSADADNDPSTDKLTIGKDKGAQQGIKPVGASKARSTAVIKTITIIHSSN